MEDRGSKGRDMSLRVTLVQGGGAGYDQVPAVKFILEQAGIPIEWDEHLAGMAAIERGRPALSEELLKSVRANGIALKTMLQSLPEGPQGNYNVRFRRELGLFASVRPLKNLRGLPARFQGVDILVIRELTEDLYAAIEHQIVPGVVQSIKVVTEAACRRFFRFAFAYAGRAGRKRVHCVHKANILKLADGLFLEVFRNTARDFPEIEAQEIIVDNCCMQLVSRPQRFDVLVMGNLYGDLVSDLGAGLVGGIDATSGINVGDGVQVFESFHGTPRDQTASHRANPLPLLLPAIDMLNAVGHKETAQRILTAVETVLTEGRAKTTDLGGQSTTMEMAQAIVGELHRSAGPLPPRAT
jgi:isocitrate dehydrogenase (NAD+)